MRGMLGAVLAATALAGCTGTDAVRVREIGSFHVGGQQVTLSGLPARELRFTPTTPPVRRDPNGDFESGQMYVQYVRLAAPAHRLPLLMWHGGGLSGVTWETKPDGQRGWQDFFMRAGYDTYVSDAMERGRASWSRYPEIFDGEPLFRTKKEAWEVFRIGPAFGGDPQGRTAFPDSQFPVGAFDQFMKQSIPRWTTTDAGTQKAYDALVDKVCPCVILAHSQGANFAFQAALRAPAKVRALVLIEPSGAPDPATQDMVALKRTPILYVWGDRLDSSAYWNEQVLPVVRRFREAHRATGAASDWIDLPAAGLRGNSHMLMMDRNSDQVAQMVERWIARHAP